MSTEYTTILEVYQLRCDIERRAKAKGIAVHLSEKNTQPCSTRTAVWLPKPTYPMLQEDLEFLKAAAIHEPLHIVRSECFDILERYGASAKEHPLLGLFNLIEDHVMEREHSSKFAGDGYDLGVGVSNQTKKIIMRMAEHKGEETNDISAKFMGSVGVVLEARQEWDKIGGANADLYIDNLTAKGQETYKKVIEAGFIDKFNSAITTSESFQLAKELYELIFDEPPPEPEDMPDDTEKTKATSEEGEEAEGEEDSDGNEKGKGDFFEIPWQKLLLSNKEHITRPGAGTPSRVDWTDWEPSYDRKWEPYSESRISVQDTLEANSHIPNGWLDSGGADKQFANQVRRLIQANMRCKFRSERETGKIHSRNLYRIAVPLVGNGEWNRRIFKKRIEAPKIDTAVTVLVDWSGSMSGSKMRLANLAAQRFNEVFSTSLNIPLEILAFSDIGKVIMGVIKPFNSKRVSSSVIASKFSNFKDYTGGNSDADAVLFSVDRLIKKKEKRKILIVLSDGSPTDAARGLAADGLARVIKELQARKDMEVYGIGIQDSNVKRFYGKTSSVVHKTEDLNSVLITTLKDTIVNHL